MELLVPYECHSCGSVDEAKFIFSGPHLKQVCNACNSYVKFFSKSAVPDIREIKHKIWAITQDVPSIEAAKNKTGFVESATGLDLKIMYWRLYLELRRQLGEEIIR